MIPATAAETTATSTAESAAASAGAIGHRTSFVDHNVAATDISAIQTADRGLSFIGRGHFHETETLGATRELVHDDSGRSHCPKGAEHVL